MSKEFKFSPSSYNDLSRPEACPKKWHAKWVTKEIPRPEPSEAMIKGQFFEYLCIGGGAREEDNVIDLPKTKAGKMTADEQRIREQAERFKEFFDPNHEDYLGLTIIGVQERVENDKLKGFLDIKVQNEDAKIGLIDLKLTQKINSPYSPFDWSDPSKTDPNQLPMYKLASDDNIDFLAYFVFDYSPDKEILYREVVLTDAGEERLLDDIESAYEVVKMYNENGWATDPSRKECLDCPLQCEDRFKTSVLKTDQIIV